MIESNLQKFQQEKSIGMAEFGWVYIPEKCKESDCPIHFHLHGCGQSETQIGDFAVKFSGFNELAESLGLIIVYPQTYDYEVEEDNTTD